VILSDCNIIRLENRQQPYATSKQQNLFYNSSEKFLGENTFEGEANVLREKSEGDIWGGISPEGSCPLPLMVLWRWRRSCERTCSAAIYIVASRSCVKRYVSRCRTSARIIRSRRVRCVLNRTAGRSEVIGVDEVLLFYGDK